MYKPFYPLEIFDRGYQIPLVRASVRLCIRASVCPSSMRGPESMRRIFLIFCMKLTYNNTTQAHI